MYNRQAYFHRNKILFDLNANKKKKGVHSKKNEERRGEK